MTKEEEVKSAVCYLSIRADKRLSTNPQNSKHVSLVNIKEWLEVEAPVNKEVGNNTSITL